MNWEHKCDLDWLKQRQKYLTASDIRMLIPYTKTGRPRTITDVERMKVMASKMIDLTEEDCMSYGAAARGHILEPYAIDNLNEMLEMRFGPGNKTFFWWDDKMVTLENRSIAFSPDAMDVPMTSNFEAPSAIAEVKSYTPERHLITAYSKPEEIEERWQMATAMALLSNIEEAHLVLFNPRMTHRKTFVITFDRDDLSKEINTILKVEEDWIEFVDNGPLTKSLPNGGYWSSVGLDESEIVRGLEIRQSLNP